MRLVDFTLRQAIAEDYPAIRTLIRAVHINPTGLDWRQFLIAVMPDGELAGCGQIKLHADGSRELASIAVREQFRGRGVARMLIERLMEEEPRPLFLMCRSRLGVLYEKFGFHIAKFEDMAPYFQRISRLARIVEFFARDGDTLLVMRLD